MVENKIRKGIATLVATTLLNGCIAPQTYSWKTESILKTEYTPITQETEEKDQYQIAATVSETGRLQFQVGIGKYETNYNVVQPITLEKQREYEFGKSKVAATWTNVGIGTCAGGTALIILLQEGGYSTSTELMMPLGLTTVAGCIIGGVSFNAFLYPKQTRPTKNYREVNVTGQQYQRHEAETILLQTVPAINALLEITSSYFGINGTEHTTITETNIGGNGAVQLVPSSPNFAFSLDTIAEIDAAQQFKQAGYTETRYLHLLQEAASPISYNVTIKTKATDGKNAEVTIPVNGYEISQKMLEKVIMGL